MPVTAARNPESPIAFQHYRELPAEMYEESVPTPSSAPEMIELNSGLLADLAVNADWFNSDSGLNVLAGNQTLADNIPVAMAYGGHQFGQWVPLLGDGRAHMLGQMTGGGATYDVQLKGSGRTRFSRGGDGRATLGSVLREYMVSEAMAGLNIPTTRSLAVIGTGTAVMRERAFPGAILARTAQSHIRVGSFQYAATALGTQSVQSLADYVIDKHFPVAGQQANRYLALLDEVISRQANLVARWMLVGFIHGVMNTDNTSIVGETIDYGPCAFMDEFHPQKVFSSIDRFGRYAWDQQPSIAYWNLTRFAQALAPLLDKTPENTASVTQNALDKFVPEFQTRLFGGFRQKFGVATDSQVVTDFIQNTFQAMAENEMDFTLFFDRLTRVAEGETESLVTDFFTHKSAGNHWVRQWLGHREAGAVEIASMRRSNPAVIARNHRIEQAINAAVDEQDFGPFRRLCRVFQNPYEIDENDLELQEAPRVEERVTQTFCGT